jgi:hypothetical protein
MTQLPPHPANADKVRAVEVLWETKGLEVLFDGVSVLGRIGAHAMLGERRVVQEALFYGFSLEDHVPRDPSCARSIASSICRRFERILNPTTVRSRACRSVSRCGESILILLKKRSTRLRCL